MKLRYVGPSFGVDGLTRGMIYEVTEDDGMYRVIDDSGEDYLYSMTNPGPLCGSNPEGRWEKVDDFTAERENEMAMKALRWIAATIASFDKAVQRDAANAEDPFTQGRAEAYGEVMKLLRRDFESFGIRLFEGEMEE